MTAGSGRPGARLGSVVRGMNKTGLCGASTCHQGHLKGNIIYVPYASSRTEVYLYIQNK